MLIRTGTGVMALLIATGLAAAAAGGASSRSERLGVAAHDLVRPGSSSTLRRILDDTCQAAPQRTGG